MLIKVKNKETHNYDIRMDAARAARKHFDNLKGLTRNAGPQRGDFKLSRQLDPLLKAHRQSKSKSDRAKIMTEYHGLQKEYRRNLLDRKYDKGGRDAEKIEI